MNRSKKKCEITACATDPRREGGFALLMTLLVLIGLTALATGGMVMSRQDLQVTRNHEASLNAFLSAEAGLYEYLGTQVNGDSTITRNLPTGTVVVQAERLLNIEDDSSAVLYRVVSQGTYSDTDGSTSTRTLTAIVLYSEGAGSATASFASGAGILKNGQSGIISGYDWATPADCSGAPGPPVAGVAVPPDGYTQTGNPQVPDGNPDIYDDLPGLELLEATGIPWDDLVNGAITPDYVVANINQWPDLSGQGPDDWPLILVTHHNFKLGNTETEYLGGQGTIVAVENLTLNGNPPDGETDPFHWDGMVLVGGKYRSNGYTEIEGSLVAGLNLLLGGTAQESDLGNGNKEIKYHSCNVARASKKWSSAGGLFEEPGTLLERM